MPRRDFTASRTARGMGRCGAMAFGLCVDEKAREEMSKR